MTTKETAAAAAPVATDSMANARRKILYLVLSLALFLSACSFSAPAPEPTPEPSPEIRKVTAVESTFTAVKSGGGRLIPLTNQGSFFYCVCEEKTGEDIPPEAVAQAKKKKRDVVNDGRYDTFAFSLYKLRPNGSLYRLPNYESVQPEENTGNWADFGSVVTVDALSVEPDGTFYILEHTATSGNSTPKDRTKYNPAKNYLEYVERYYLRTLDSSGKELKRVEISPEEAANQYKTRFTAPAIHAEGNRVYGPVPETYEAPAAEPSSETRTEDPANLLFCLTEAGVNPAALCSDIIETEWGEYRFLASSYNAGQRTYSYELVSVTLRETDEEQYPVLRLGCYESGFSARLLKEIALFNREHPECTLRPVQLSGESPEERNTEIQHNKVDIIYCDTQACTDLAVQGALTDLYLFLDQDSRLKREDYFPNLFALAEHGGALCSTASGFTVDTVIGAKSRVGDRCCWTYDDLREAWGALGIGTDAFHVYTDREDVFRACLEMDLSTLVTYDAAENLYHVDSDRLSALQWFSGNFPESFDYAGRRLTAADATDLRIRAGKQLLNTAHLTSWHDLKIIGSEFEEEIAFIGWPTPEGCGSVAKLTTLDPGMNFSLTAACSRPSEAWQFLRRYFTGAWQTELYKEEICFPTHIRCFERGLRAAMTGEYAVDRNGELVYDNNNQLIFVSQGTLYLSDFTELRYFPVSEERAASFRTLVESISKTTGSLPAGDAILEELTRQSLKSDTH